MSHAVAAQPTQAIRLRRRTEHRLVAGVAGGIADRLNAPVWFVRGWFALTMSGIWPVVVIYALVALVLPAAGRSRPDWDNVVGLARLAVIWGGLTLGGVAPVSLDDPLRGSPGWWIAYLALPLYGAVVLLDADYRRGRALTAVEARTAVVAAIPVVAAATVVVGGVILVPDVRWDRFVGAVPLIGALALLLGRRRAFIAPALLALALATLLLAADVRLQGGVGDARLRPTATGEPIVARHAVGTLDLRLGAIRPGREPVEVVASLGIGTLHLKLPRGVRVEASLQVGKGPIEVSSYPDRPQPQGFDRRLSRAFTPSRRDRRRPGLIRVHAEVGYGEIYVHSAGSIYE